MQFLWKYVDDFVGKGFDFYIIAELMFYASATFVPMALPLAVLLSSLMTFGNLGENYELVAIKSAGISLQKVMRPLIIFIFFVSIGAFYFSNYVLPKANLEFFSLLSDVRKKKPAVSIEEGVFNSDIGNYVIKIGHKDPDGVGIRDVIIYDHSKKDGNKNVTRARTGRMEMSEDRHFLILTLNNGVNYNESVQENNRGTYFPIQITRFSKEIQRIDLSEFNFKKSDKSLRKNNYQMLNVRQLQYFEDSLTRQNDSSIREFVSYSLENISFYNKFIGNHYGKVDSLINSPVQTPKVKATLSETTKKEISNKDKEAEKQIIVHSPKVIIGRHNKKKLDSLLINIDKAVVENKYISDSNKIDSLFLFSPDILSHFDSLEQVRIVVGALSFARNASYQASNIKKRNENRMLYIAKYKVEWHRKFTLSIACLILFFIGAPLGAIIRKGGIGMPLVISILMFVMYHVFTIIGEKSVKSEVMEPWLGMWMASLIYLPLGIFFTWKATTDAPLLDAEAWHKAFSKVDFITPIINKLKSNSKGE